MSSVRVLGRVGYLALFAIGGVEMEATRDALLFLVSTPLFARTVLVPLRILFYSIHTACASRFARPPQALR